MAIASIGIILSRQQTTKALIRLCGCTGCSAALLFAYGKSRFSHDVAHMFFFHSVYVMCAIEAEGIANSVDPNQISLQEKS